MIRLDIEGVTAAEAQEYVLAGLQRKRDGLQAQIDAVSGKTTAGAGATAKSAAKATKTPKKPQKQLAKGQMSEAGKARIVAAQKKRWAKVRKDAKAAKTAAAQEQINHLDTADQDSLLEEARANTPLVA